MMTIMWFLFQAVAVNDDGGDKDDDGDDYDDDNNI